MLEYIVYNYFYFTKIYGLVRLLYIHNDKVVCIQNENFTTQNTYLSNN